MESMQDDALAPPTSEANPGVAGEDAGEQVSQQRSSSPSSPSSLQWSVPQLSSSSEAQEEQREQAPTHSSSAQAADAAPSDKGAAGGGTFPTEQTARSSLSPLTSSSSSSPPSGQNISPGCGNSKVGGCAGDGLSVPRVPFASSAAGGGAGPGEAGSSGAPPQHQQTQLGGGQQGQPDQEPSQTPLGGGGQGESAHQPQGQQQGQSPPRMLAPGSSQQQQQQAQAQQQQLQQRGARELKVEDALKYLDEVKREFMLNSRVYNEFLDIMKKFKTHAIDTPGVMEHVSKLFRGNNKLILGFNTFLPDGFKIDLKSIEESNRRADEEAASAAKLTHQRLQQQRGGGGGGMSPLQGQGQGASSSSSSLQAGYDTNQRLHQQQQQRERQQVMASHQRQQQHQHMAAMQQQQQQQQQQHARQMQQQHAAAMLREHKQQQQQAHQQHQQQQQSTGHHQQGQRQTGQSGGQGFQSGSQQGQHRNGQAFDRGGGDVQVVGVTGGTGGGGGGGGARGGGGQGQGGGGSHSPLPQQQPEFKRAINYVTKIKNRFNDDQDTYKRFLDILHNYQKQTQEGTDGANIEHVLDQVSELFKDHDDLLMEFTYFLPDNVQEQAKDQLEQYRADIQRRRQRKGQGGGGGGGQGQGGGYGQGSGGRGGGQRGGGYGRGYGGSGGSGRGGGGGGRLSAVRYGDGDQGPSSSGGLAQSGSGQGGGYGGQGGAGGGSKAAGAGGGAPRRSQADARRANLAASTDMGGGGLLYEEKLFFDKAKEALSHSATGRNDHWDDLVRVLELYGAGQPLGGDTTATRPDLLGAVNDCLVRFPELMREFRDLVVGRRSSTEDSVVADSYNHAKSMHEIETGTCEKVTCSYRRLPPDYPPCSFLSRPAEEAAVLNDLLVSVNPDTETTGPGNSSLGSNGQPAHGGAGQVAQFKHMRKNEFEDRLYKFEDERFEVDMVVDATKTTLCALEKLACEVKLLAAFAYGHGSDSGDSGQGLVTHKALADALLLLPEGHGDNGDNDDRGGGDDSTVIREATGIAMTATAVNVATPTSLENGGRVGEALLITNLAVRSRSAGLPGGIKAALAAVVRAATCGVDPDSLLEGVALPTSSISAASHHPGSCTTKPSDSLLSPAVGTEFDRSKFAAAKAFRLGMMVECAESAVGEDNEGQESALVSNAGQNEGSGGGGGGQGQKTTTYFPSPMVSGAGRRALYYRLDPKTLTTVHKNCIGRVYGADAKDEVLEFLHTNPAHCLPLVVRRLRQQVKEWEKARRDLNTSRRWREDSDKAWLRSLDHRSFAFARNEKRKVVQSKALVDEIKALLPDHYETKELADRKVTAGSSNGGGLLSSGAGSASPASAAAAAAEAAVRNTSTRAALESNHNNSSSSSSQQNGSGGNGNGDGGNNAEARALEAAAAAAKAAAVAVRTAKKKADADRLKPVGPGRALVASDTFVGLLHLPPPPWWASSSEGLVATKLADEQLATALKSAGMVASNALPPRRNPMAQAAAAGSVELGYSQVKPPPLFSPEGLTSSSSSSTSRGVKQEASKDGSDDDAADKVRGSEATCPLVGCPHLFLQLDHDKAVRRDAYELLCYLVEHSEISDPNRKLDHSSIQGLWRRTLGPLLHLPPRWLARAEAAKADAIAQAHAEKQLSTSSSSSSTTTTPKAKSNAKTQGPSGASLSSAGRFVQSRPQEMAKALVASLVLNADAGESSLSLEGEEDRKAVVQAAFLSLLKASEAPSETCGASVTAEAGVKKEDDDEEEEENGGGGSPAVAPSSSMALSPSSRNALLLLKDDTEASQERGAAAAFPPVSSNGDGDSDGDEAMTLLDLDELLEGAFPYEPGTDVETVFGQATVLGFHHHDDDHDVDVGVGGGEGVGHDENAAAAAAAAGSPKSMYVLALHCHASKAVVCRVRPEAILYSLEANPGPDNEDDDEESDEDEDAERGGAVMADEDAAAGGSAKNCEKLRLPSRLKNRSGGGDEVGEEDEESGDDDEDDGNPLAPGLRVEDLDGLSFHPPNTQTFARLVEHAVSKAVSGQGTEAVYRTAGQAAWEQHREETHEPVMAHGPQHLYLLLRYLQALVNRLTHAKKLCSEATCNRESTLLHGLFVASGLEPSAASSVESALALESAVLAPPPPPPSSSPLCGTGQGDAAAASGGSGGVPLAPSSSPTSTTTTTAAAAAATGGEVKVAPSGSKMDDEDASVLLRVPPPPPGLLLPVSAYAPQPTSAPGAAAIVPGIAHDGNLQGGGFGFGVDTSAVSSSLVVGHVVYSAFLQLAHSLLDGSTEMGKFEESCRLMLGNRGYVCFTLDKVVGQCLKHLAATAVDPLFARLDAAKQAHRRARKASKLQAALLTETETKEADTETLQTAPSSPLLKALRTSLNQQRDFERLVVNSCGGGGGKAQEMERLHSATQHKDGVVETAGDTVVGGSEAGCDGSSLLQVAANGSSGSNGHGNGCAAAAASSASSSSAAALGGLSGSQSSSSLAGAYSSVLPLLLPDVYAVQSVRDYGHEAATAASTSLTAPDAPAVKPATLGSSACDSGSSKSGRGGVVLCVELLGHRPPKAQASVAKAARGDWGSGGRVAALGGGGGGGGGVGGSTDKVAGVNEGGGGADSCATATTPTTTDSTAPGGGGNGTGEGVNGNGEQSGGDASGVGYKKGRDAEAGVSVKVENDEEESDVNGSARAKRARVN